MRYLVLGATGFVGGHIAAELLRTGGMVRVLAQDRQQALSLVAQGADLVRGNPTDVRSLVAALEGAEVLVYAGDHYTPSRSAGTARIDPDLLDRTLHACRYSQLARVVLVSGTDIHGPRLPSEMVDERCSLRGQGPSHRALAEAEEVAHQYSSDLPTTILRPVPLIGPGDPELTRELTDLLQAPGGIDLPQNGKAAVSLLYAADLGRAVAAAARHPAAPGRTYVVRGFDTTWRQLLTALGQQMGREPRFRPFPNVIARLASAWSGRPGQLAESYVGLPRVFNDNRFRTEVGWRPEWDLEQAVAAIAAGCSGTQVGMRGAWSPA